jgi:hypothetical protein
MSNKFKKAIEVRAQEPEGLTPHTYVVDELVVTPTLDLWKTKEDNTSSNKTYYLENKVTKAISKVSKENKISESKAVNDILKHFLNIK